MGGDHAPEEIVDGALQAAAELGVGILLIGREDAVARLLPDDAEAAGVQFEHADDVVAMDESLRIVAAVRKTRKAHRPIWSDKAEAVPAAAPGVGYPAALQHQVVHARPRELEAQRQAGLAATDYQDLIARQGQVDLKRVRRIDSRALHTAQVARLESAGCSLLSTEIGCVKS